MKTALITGATGMDAGHLTKYLIEEQKYKVVGILRRTSWPTDYRLQKLDLLKYEQTGELVLEYADVIDFSSMYKVIKKHKPDEIYVLHAQSHVGISFNNPISTLQYNTMGYLNLLEIVRDMEGYNPKIYFAASSEMFGISPPPQNENTPFMPVSPYGCSKICSFHLGRVYRHAYGMFICNGILFNHSEGLTRGLNFVTKKIGKIVSEIVTGKETKLILGNIDSMRDEGYSPTYVKYMHKMLQQDKPDDYVLATGESHTIRDFVKETFDLLEVDYKDYLELSDKFKRPFDLPSLLGDASKAKRILGFKHVMGFKDMVKDHLIQNLKEYANLTGTDEEILEKAKEMIK